MERRYSLGYLLKKGENLAPHQDLRKLVDQVRPVTKVEGIQAKLCEEVCGRKKLSVFVALFFSFAENPTAVGDTAVRSAKSKRGSRKLLEANRRYQRA